MIGALLFILIFGEATMAGAPHWDDDPEAWDLLILGTQPMPGVWDVEDGNVKRVFDIKKAPGLDGARIKDQGYENGQLTLVGQLYEPEDWETLQVIIQSIKPVGGKRRDPVAISHPKTLFLGITTVEIQEVSTPTLDNGIMTVTIKAIEFIAMPKATKKSTGTPGAVSGPSFNAVTGVRDASREPPDWQRKGPLAYLPGDGL